MFYIIELVLFCIRVWVLAWFSFSRLCVLLLFMLVSSIVMVEVLVLVVMEWNSMFMLGLCWFIGGLLCRWYMCLVLFYIISRCWLLGVI